MALAVLDSNVHQLGIFGLLGGGKNEGGVGGGILRLVFADCCGILVFCSEFEGGGELELGMMDWGWFGGRVTYMRNHLWHNS